MSVTKSTQGTGSHPDLSKLDDNVTTRSKRKQPETDCECKQELINLGQKMQDMFLKFSNEQKQYFSSVHDDMTLIKTKIDNIQTTTDFLVSEHTKILTEISDLKSKSNATEDKIKQLESNIQDLSNGPAQYNPQSSTEELIHEITDRAERQKNVIVIGVSEHEEGTSQERQTRDRTEISNILKSVLRTETPLQPWKLQRIGKQKLGVNRPLKLCFDTGSVAKDILKHRNNVIDKGIKIFADQTPAQQSYIKKLREELSNRVRNGEADLTIKYVKGQPKIVNLSKNDKDQYDQ